MKLNAKNHYTTLYFRQDWSVSRRLSFYNRERLYSRALLGNILFTTSEISRNQQTYFHMYLRTDKKCLLFVIFIL